MDLPKQKNQAQHAVLYAQATKASFIYSSYYFAPKNSKPSPNFNIDIAFIPIRILNGNLMYSRNRQILNQQATPNHQSFHLQQRHIGQSLSSWKANISGKKSSITRQKQLLLQKMMICQLSWEDASLYLKICSSQDTAHCCRIGFKGLNRTRM